MTASRFDVAGVLLRRGRQRYGETVTQLAHALQCAAHARAAGADDDLVLAALLHDIGHLAGRPDEAAVSERDGRGESPEDHHGHHGAAVLRPYVPERIAWIVEHHVVAKRYLCAVEADYAAGLSPASVRSLARQGGPLTPEACRALEGHRWFSDALAVRRWDDAAKDQTTIVPPLETYLPLLARYFGPPSPSR